MLGAIIGDIVGSRFEFNNHKSKEFDLFTDDCYITDDSIMTLAVAKAIMDTDKIKQPSVRSSEYDSEYYSILKNMAIKNMQEIGRRYPDCGYGGMFSRWVFSNDPKPYHSYGNGAAMRISPAGFAAMTEHEAQELSEAITSVTHDHAEGLKGAESVSAAVFMARRGFTKSEMKEKLSKYYNLEFNIDDTRDTYRFNETCQDTVPQAIAAFLESNSFEDAVRIAISVGGDSDTLAAITCSIAEAYYGVPEDIRTKALRYLDDDLRAIFDEWEAYTDDNIIKEQFKVLTKYIGKFTDITSCGEEGVDNENDGTSEHPIHASYVYYSELVLLFIQEFYEFSYSHPEYELTNYDAILEKNGLKWEGEQICGANTEKIEAQGILALIMGAIRADHFCEGAFYAFFKDGFILKWLKRLKAIDCNTNKPPIEAVFFEIGGFGGYDTYHLVFSDNTCVLRKNLWLNDASDKIYTPEETLNLYDKLTELHIEYWNREYSPPPYIIICDGTQWFLSVKRYGRRGTAWEGDNSYPPNWNDLLVLFDIDGPGADEVIYCSISFKEGGRSLYYQTNDTSIEIGERVLVPFGASNMERVGIVEDIEYFDVCDVPFPLEKTKWIIGKIPAK